jgi:penicillin amidase
MPKNMPNCSAIKRGIFAEICGRRQHVYRNPDDETLQKSDLSIPSIQAIRLGAEYYKTLFSYLIAGPLKMGSNSWVVSPDLSPGGKSILANDPHQSATILPGPWYPCGLIAPDIRAVGVTVPGLGGMAVGRTEHIVLGVTNACGDTQDRI